MKVNLAPLNGGCTARARWTAAFSLFCLAIASGAVQAQPVPAPQSAPAEDSLALAHTLIAKMNTGGLAAMTGLTPPIAGLMHAMKVHPDQSKAVMTEAIMPVLLNHSDEMTDIEAHSYAAVLSPDTMKAAIAFYDSDAGKALIRAHMRVTQMNMTGISDLFEKLRPEFDAKTEEVFKAHGWTKG